MPSVKLKKANFTAGELAPTLLARSDIKQYLFGASKMRNVFPLPHGGFKRRPGLAYQAQAEYQDYVHYQPTVGTTVFSYANIDTGTAHTAGQLQVIRKSPSNLGLEIMVLGTDYTEQLNPTSTITLTSSVSDGNLFIISKIGAHSIPVLDTGDVSVSGGAAGAGSYGLLSLFEFEFSTEEVYLLAFSIFTLNIYRKVSGVWTHQAVLTTSYYNTSIETLNVTQQLDSAIIFSTLSPPLWVQRTGSHTSWSIEEWSFVNTPQFDFDDDDSPDPSVAVAHQERINFVTFSDGDRYTLYVDGEETDEIEYDSTPADNITNLQAGLNALSNTESSGVTVAQEGASLLKFIITVGGSNKKRFWDFDSGNTIFDSSNNEIVLLSEVKGQGNIEDVWSKKRGYPVSGTFFQNRLWIGGTKSKPQSTYSSRSGNFNDFNSELTLADYGINYSADTNKVSAFYNIHAGRHLQYFSSSAEFYVPVSDKEAVTPENFVLRRTSQKGSKQGPRVFEIDGAVMFVQRFGKTIQEFLFTDETLSYVPTSISKLAPHLISNPKFLAYRPSISTEDADYLYAVNDDGTLAVFNTLRQEQINAWSLCTTDGDFECVAVVDTDSIFGVRRTIDVGAGAVERVYIEMFEDGLYVDSGISKTEVASSSTALNHLGGQVISTLLDGNVQVDITLTASASPGLTFARATATDWQGGLAFPDVSGASKGWETWVELLPFEPDPAGQSVRGGENSVVDAYLSVYETSHCAVKVDDGDVFPLPFQAVGASLLDTPIPVFTGVKEMKGLLGWNEQSRLSIVQTQHLGMTVLGITTEVTF